MWRSGQKQRQIVFDPGRKKSLCHIFVEPALGRIAFEFFAEADPKRSACSLVRWEFAGGQEANIIDFVDTALAIDVECAQAVNLVVEQIDAVGQGAAHRK
jgi:hypothetical protein